jgi:hypothetical protein
MKLAFLLSMPGNNSCNGRWSGDGQCYAAIRSVSKKQRDRITKQYYSYNFGDGWCAAVEVKEVDGPECRLLRKRSKGFRGYEWMIDSIISDGAIYGPTQLKPEPASI